MSAQSSVSGTADVGTGFATHVAGDVVATHPFLMYPYSGVMIAAGAIVKGAVVTLTSQLPYTTGDLGPFGVATAAIASGQDMASNVTGNCLLVFGRVYMNSGATIALGAFVVPSTGTNSTQVVTVTTKYLSNCPTASIIMSGFIKPLGIAITGVSGAGLFVMQLV